MSSSGYVLTVCVFRIIKDRTPFLELYCGFILTTFTAKARNNKYGAYKQQRRGRLYSKTALKK